MTTAATWFADEREFRQLCGDAQSQAIDERSQELGNPADGAAVTLSARLLTAIPRAGIHLRVLRAQLHDVPPVAIDCALTGLRTAGQLRIILGMVSAPLRRGAADFPRPARCDSGEVSRIGE